MQLAEKARLTREDLSQIAYRQRKPYLTTAINFLKHWKSQ